MPAEGDQKLVRMAGRALGRSGLANAYGHCSKRIDDSSFLVCSPRAMGLIKPGEPGIVVPVRGALPPGTLGEVRVHQQIYGLRPDIGGICRFLSPMILSLGALGRAPSPRTGYGAYFGERMPFWNDVELLRSDEKARAVAEHLGAARGIILRANGAVVVGESIQIAVVLSWFLEDAARVELDVLRCGLEHEAPRLAAGEIAARDTFAGGVVERMWDFLTDGDPEA